MTNYVIGIVLCIAALIVILALKDDTHSGWDE